MSADGWLQVSTPPAAGLPLLVCSHKERRRMQPVRLPGPCMCCTEGERLPPCTASALLVCMPDCVGPLRTTASSRQLQWLALVILL